MNGRGLVSSRFLASVVALAMGVACTRSEGTAPAGSTSAAPPSSAAPAASGSATASASAAPAAPAASAPAAECGTKPLPDCPLQAWMKANANPPATANDMPALAIALEKMVAFAPPGYTNWASIAKDGAAAAKSGDTAAAKASCRSCHDQYKAKYKAELRARKI